MKEIFDRHQDKLNPSERHEIWRRISASPERKPVLRWGLSTAAASLVAVVIVVAVFRIEPMFSPRSAPESTDPAVLMFETIPPMELKAETDDNRTGTEERYELYMDEVLITGEKQIDTKTSMTKQSVPGDAMALKAGPTASSGETHYRGGRAGEVRFQLQGEGEFKPQATPPPVYPETGGTDLPNDEPYDAMYFDHAGVNPFIATEEDALSTFAVDVDAASYTITRRYIGLGHLPPKDAVRVEEFVNFFPQGYPEFENEDFRILIDGAPSPFGEGYHLLRVGLKGREVSGKDRKPAQLTFVVDISGSMDRENRLGLVKRSLHLLVDQLRDEDRIGIVVYGSRGHILLEPTAIGSPPMLRAGEHGYPEDPRDDDWARSRPGRERILAAIDRLQPGGSTNAEEGLLLAYEMARREYRPEGINRLVLCSDGVANVGRTGPDSILDRVRREADRGIYLSTIGFGMGNYNDILMEQLANSADGNYYYVDHLDEARRVFVENLTGTLQTIAKDAKIQVEFDPAQVKRYRLLGFENRDVADRDFRNDKVDAGEIGAGHEVTALYEVKLADEKTRGTIATVRFRYARPENEGSGAPDVREIAKGFRARDLSSRFEKASPHFRLDAAVAEFAEILRGSYWAKESSLTDVLPVARSAARDLGTEVAAEFVGLVEKASQLSATSAPDER